MRLLRELPLLTSLALAASAGLARPAAAAGPKDQAARKLDNDAMANDYLATAFPRAEKKLQKALSICGASGCSASTLALLHRDLGVVYFLGLGKREEGKAELARAVAADRELTLDADLSTPELRRAFEEAKGAGPPPSGSGIGHAPVAAQAVRTPIPLYATAAPALGGRLTVRYKGVGASRWKSVPMKPHDDGFAAEIPCQADVQPGEVAYYLQATDESGSITATSGSREDPLRVTIARTVDEPPHLPGAAPPARCEAAEEGGEEPAAPETSPERRNWLTLTVEQDLALAIGNTTEVCAEANQVSGPYSCFRATGTQYHGTPVAGRFDSITAGPAVATTRIHLGYDRVLFAGVTAGFRVGFVIRGGGPASEGSGASAFLPVHAEARVAYWFGQDAFSRTGLRPFLFAAGGAAQVDSKFSIGVFENKRVPPAASQIDNPSTQILAGYRHMGQLFAGGGLGAMYAFTPGSGVVVDLKVMELFPTAGTALSPELGLALGF